MNELKGTKIQTLLDLTETDFLQTVIRGYLESEPEKEASTDDLAVVANWAKVTCENAMLLEMLFERKVLATVVEGEVEVRLPG